MSPGIAGFPSRHTPSNWTRPLSRTGNRALQQDSGHATRRSRGRQPAPVTVSGAAAPLLAEPGHPGFVCRQADRTPRTLRPPREGAPCRSTTNPLFKLPAPRAPHRAARVREPPRRRRGLAARAAEPVRVLIQVGRRRERQRHPRGRRYHDRQTAPPPPRRSSISIYIAALCYIDGSLIRATAVRPLRARTGSGAEQRACAGRGKVSRARGVAAAEGFPPLDEPVPGSRGTCPGRSGGRCRARRRRCAGASLAEPTP
jgi:hypothetical protein